MLLSFCTLLALRCSPLSSLERGIERLQSLLKGGESETAKRFLTVTASGDEGETAAAEQRWQQLERELAKACPRLWLPPLLSLHVSEEASGLSRAVSFGGLSPGDFLTNADDEKDAKRGEGAVAMKAMEVEEVEEQKEERPKVVSKTEEKREEGQPNGVADFDRFVEIAVDADPFGAFEAVRLREGKIGSSAER